MGQGAHPVWLLAQGGLLLGGALLVSACSDPVARIRKPELAICERFVRARLKVPGSYDRSWYNIADFPVSRAVLAEATGDKKAAAAAPNPGIRRIYVQYQATNGLDQTADGSGLCLFPMSDAGRSTYVGDPDALIDAAIHENEQRALQSAQGQNVTSIDCCVRPDFDRSKLTVVHPVARGTIPEGRKL